VTEEKERLPKFRNEEEAAAFWDTHSPLDFPEEFKEVEVKLPRALFKRGLTIKLGEDTIEELRTRGQRQGIGPTTLARMWILEHLKEIKEKESRSTQAS